MNKYKININRTPPRPEDIAKLRNFDQVLGSISGGIQPFYKRLWFITAAAAIIIVGLVSSVFYMNHVIDNKEANNKKHLPFIQTTPIAVSYETYEVNCNDSTGITTSSGTVIQIPKGSLVDAKGNAVSGDVKVKFREFRDAADFLCSGIPMSYDSAGTTYFFESAGMFDIGAFKDDNALQVASQKNLKVEMATKYNPVYYNQYYLDTLNKRWEYKGKDVSKNLIAGDSIGKHNQATAINTGSKKVMNNIVPSIVDKNPVEKATLTENKLHEEIAVIQKTKPVPPVKANPKRTHFNFNFNKKDFPEMEAYKDVLFDVGEENKKFNDSYYDMTWESVKIEEGPKKGVNFKLTLMRRKEKVELIVYPVYDGKNYDAAKTQYAQLLDDYNKKLAVKKQEAETARLEAEARLEELKKQAEENEKNAYIAKEKERNEQLAALEERKQRANEIEHQAIVAEEENLKNAGNSAKFWHIVTVSKMGTWNNDCPRKLENKQTIYTTCIDENENEFSPMGDVYLIDKNMNACISSHPDSWNDKWRSYHVGFNRKSENILVTFIEGKLAILKAEDFKKYTSTPSGMKQKVKFELKQDVKSVKDVRRMLEL
jgi:hypothetical protein